MPSLTKRNKTECKVIVTVLAVAMLLKKIDEKVNKEDNNLAIDSCTNYIDSILQDKSEEKRSLMHKKIDTARIRLTKKTNSIDLVSGLVGALRYFTGGSIKTKTGTKLDFMKTKFRKNLSNIESQFDYDEESAKTFEKKLREVVNSI